ncbi:MAG: hypothetical protein IKP62_03620 [Salinivirgaceae bacterium]|nr:hypothetical protein [Salinivirgaceae bacterium]
MLETNKEDVNGKYLIINDEHPQSIFATYYAKTFYTSLYEGSDYLNKSYDDCFDETNADLSEVEGIMNEVVSKKLHNAEKIMKFLYINIITIIDAFVCSIILSTITKDELLFNEYADEMLSKTEKKEFDCQQNGQKGDSEHKVLEKTMRISYANVDTIKNSFKAMNFKPLNFDKEIMDKHFKNRHILVHRNGKTKDGKRISITDVEVKKLLSDAAMFLDEVKNSLPAY